MRLRVVILGLTAAGCIGCVRSKNPISFWKIEAPTARVVGARVAQATGEGARIEVTVELSNPNEVPLPLVSDSYLIEVDGVGQASMSDKPNCTIPARGVQRVVLPVAFATRGKSPAGVGWAVQGHVVYQPPGEVRALLTESEIPLPRAAFFGSGRLE